MLIKWAMWVKKNEGYKFERDSEYRGRRRVYKNRKQVIETEQRQRKSPRIEGMTAPLTHGPLTATSINLPELPTPSYPTL